MSRNRSRQTKKPMEGIGVVKAVHSADTLVLLHPQRTPPVEKWFRLADVRVPRVGRDDGRRKIREDPFGFEAREYVRRALVGRMVRFRVEFHHEQLGRDFGHVFPSGDSSDIRGSLGFDLLNRGYAKLSNAERAPPAFQEAEQRARDAHTGVWIEDEDELNTHVRPQFRGGTQPSQQARNQRNRRGRGRGRQQPAASPLEKRILDTYGPSSSGARKPVRVVVNYVSTASTVKVMFPDLGHEETMVHLTGVRSPGFSKERIQVDDDDDEGPPQYRMVAEEFAEDAKHFCELRILHRDVDMIVDGRDSYGFIVGTFLCPSLTPYDRTLRRTKLQSQDELDEAIEEYETSLFQEELLIRGFAKYNERYECSVADHEDLLRAAEIFAKRNLLRLYEDYEPPQRSIAPDDDRLLSFRARIVEVMSGDMLRIRYSENQDQTTELPPPLPPTEPAEEEGEEASGEVAERVVPYVARKWIEERISLASIRSQRFGSPVRLSKAEEQAVIRSFRADSRTQNKRRRRGGRKQQPQQQQQAEEDQGRRGDEVFATEAKEMIRKQLSGGEFVTVNTDYFREIGSRNDKQLRRYCTVYNAAGDNIAKPLVEQGYASVLFQRYDEERSEEYAHYRSLERKAKRDGRGIHSGRLPPLPSPIRDFGSRRSVDSLSTIVELMGPRAVPAVVEKVYTGTRYRLFLPKHNLLLNFVLSGALSPFMRGEGQVDPAPFAVEARDFAEDKLLLRTVQVSLAAVDRGGNACGTMLVGKKNFLDVILETGLAVIREASAHRLDGYSRLQRVQAQAKEAGRCIWMDEEHFYPRTIAQQERRRQEQVQEEVGEDEEEESRPEPTLDDAPVGSIQVYPEKPLLVRVTEVCDATHFYMQTADAKRKLQKLQGLIDAADLDMHPPYMPQIVGEKVFARYSIDDSWYRGLVGEIDLDNEVCKVAFIDYGNVETVALDDLREYTVREDISAQGKEVFLAHVKCGRAEQEDATRMFQRATAGRELQGVLEYSDFRTNRFYVSLYDRTSKQNIVANMIRQGAYQVHVPRNVRAAFQDDLGFDSRIRNLKKAARATEDV